MNKRKEELHVKKDELRQLILSQRQTIDPKLKSDYDNWICDQLYTAIEDWDYQVIHTFIPMNDEINILPLIDRLLKEGRIIITPKTMKDRQMQNLILQSTTALEPGLFGTQHPANSIEYIGEINLIITPGLAYDYKGNRLGYGGGYYDTFLSEQQNAHSIGIAYPFQRIKYIPVGSTDYPVNDVISKREF